MTQGEPGCRDFEADLSAWIDGELPAPRRAAVGAHLAGCPACAARVEELRAVDRALRALPSPTAGAELRERLAGRLSAGREAPGVRRPPARARRRLAPALALPLAAAAALALYLALRPRAAIEPPTPPQIAERGPDASPDAARGRGAASPDVARGPGAASPDVELEALDAEDLAVVLDLETIEDLPVIANLEVLERLLGAEAG